jgi:hypothetical protein
LFGAANVSAQASERIRSGIENPPTRSEACPTIPAAPPGDGLLDQIARQKVSFVQRFVTSMPRTMPGATPKPYQIAERKNGGEEKAESFPAGGGDEGRANRLPVRLDLENSTDDSLAGWLDAYFAVEGDCQKFRVKAGFIRPA